MLAVQFLILKRFAASLRPPIITSGPVSGSHAVGSRVGLSCMAGGVPTPSITWLFNGQPRSDLPSVPSITIIATPGNRGLYACRAQNSQGTTTSLEASIQINGGLWYTVMV